MYFVKFFNFIFFCQNLIPDRNRNFSHKIKVRDPTSFSQTHHIDLILFLKKQITYFLLSEKLKRSEKSKHLELNQYTKKISYTTRILFSQKYQKFWFWQLLPFDRKGQIRGFYASFELRKLFFSQKNK